MSEFDKAIEEAMLHGTSIIHQDRFGNLTRIDPRKFYKKPSWWQRIMLWLKRKA